MKTENLEHAVLSVRTVIIALVVILGAVITGAVTMANADNDITTNAKGVTTNAEAIAEVKVDLEDLEVTTTAQYKDIKRGMDDNKDLYNATHSQIDMLIQELRIRNVISETATANGGL